MLLYQYDLNVEPNPRCLNRYFQGYKLAVSSAFEKHWGIAGT